MLPIKYKLLDDKVKLYAEFEARGNLYLFTRIPFGVKNGVPTFQRTLTDNVQSEDLEDLEIYNDDVCGKW